MSLASFISQKNLQNQKIENNENLDTTKKIDNVEERKPLKINYGTTRVLKVIIYCSGNKKFSWNIKYPLSTITKATIETLINAMVSDNMINYGGFEALGLDDAYFYETRTIELQS